MKRYALICLLAFYWSNTLNAQIYTDPKARLWVDSVFNKLNKREKIAQMVMIRVNSNKNQGYQDSIAKVVRKQKLGGIVVFQGGPQRQVAFLSRLQADADIPLLVAMDAENGTGMRLDSANTFPLAMTLGAIQDNRLLYKMGQEIAQELSALGVGMNFAPVVDINSNRANPVIAMRSFGENKFNVVEKSLAYMQGLQEGGVIATIKHFPGHGDTDVDSHVDLPVLKHSIPRLDSLELYPFKILTNAGAGAVMVAHMNIPTMDADSNRPSSLSYPIVTQKLKQEMKFKGLVISDAMDMKGVSKYYPEGKADVEAIRAGNDIIELPEDSKRAIKLIKRALRKDILSWDSVNNSVKKILYAKYFVKQHQFVIKSSLKKYLNRESVKTLKKELCQSALTLLKNEAHLLPLNPYTNKRILCISVGLPSIGAWQQELAKEIPVQFANLSKESSVEDIAQMEEKMKQFDVVVIAVHDSRKTLRSKLDFSDNLWQYIGKYIHQAHVATLWFANPYTLDQVPNNEKGTCILLGYQNTVDMQNSTIGVLLGKFRTSGKLPVTINKTFFAGWGL